MQKEVNINK